MKKTNRGNPLALNRIKWIGALVIFMAAVAIVVHYFQGGEIW